jgi:hypothetical protein
MTDANGRVDPNLYFTTKENGAACAAPNIES